MRVNKTYFTLRVTHAHNFWDDKEKMSYSKKSHFGLDMINPARRKFYSVVALSDILLITSNVTHVAIMLSDMTAII